MEIYFINFCSQWLFNLYKEYLFNLKYYIIKRHSIFVHIKIIENIEFNSREDLEKKLNIKKITLILLIIVKKIYLFLKIYIKKLIYYHHILILIQK